MSKFREFLVFEPGKSSAWILLILTFCMAGVIEYLIESYFLQQAQYQQQIESKNRLSLVRARIEGVINSNILLVQGFSSVVSTNPDIDQQYFSQIGRDITKNSTIIRNIAAAPDMVISLMYPIEGNEAAIGLDYNKHPQQRDAAYKVIETGKLILAGPVQLKQGGVGFIARIPVYTNVGLETRFWGLLSSVMDVDRFYREAGLFDQSLDLLIAIKGRDAKGKDGELFFGPESIYQQSPVTETINLPYGSWQLAAIPRHGWLTRPPYLWQTRSVALITTLLLLSLIYVKVKSNSQRKLLTSDLKAANHRFTSVLDGMNAAVYVADMQDYEVLYANPKTLETFGQDIVGKKCWQTLQSGQTGPCDFCTNPQLIDENGSANPCFRNEMVNTVTGSWIHTEAQAIPWDDGHLVRLAVGTDISKMKENEALLHEAHKNLEAIAYYDPLTDLPNRRLLAEKFDQMVKLNQRTDNKLAICYLDLDGFKRINDQFGHKTGDELLIQVAYKLKNVLREGDTIARWGGDEFSLILTIDILGDLHEIMQRILSTVSGKYALDEANAFISASIGVAIYPQDETDLDSLLRQADQAMYTAKQKGKQQYCLFDSERDKQIHEVRNQLTRISKAISDNEMVLFYQPKISIGKATVYGVEALIRWDNPEGEMIYPLDFLPIIQRSEVQCQLDLWVISTAIQQAQLWHQKGIHLSVSVNVSPYSLQQEEFTEQLFKFLERHPIPENLLEMEILESDLADIDTITMVISKLKKSNICFALDDYGTGYSSLTYLRQLPVHTLKIDQSFVRDMLIDENDLNIVEGVIGLARAFKKEVIAEGVETIEHGVKLAAMGCTNLQGYGIARPMPLATLEDWLQHYQIPVDWRLENKSLTLLSRS